MNEKERAAFLTYAETILAECKAVRLEEGIFSSVCYSNMQKSIKEPRQFYALGHAEGREKMAKELITILKALSTAEQHFSEEVVKQSLLKIAKDRRWQRKKK